LRCLASRTRESDTIAFLPIPAGGDVEDYRATAEWMYWQMRHGRPMVNGYSGFFPSEYERLREDAAGFPDPRSVGRLHRYGVRYCIVPRSYLGPAEVALGAARTLSRVRLGLVRVLAD